MSTDPVFVPSDPVDAYQAVYDALGKAYWESSDLTMKDQVQGARDAVYDIITQIDEAELEANTANFVAIMPEINAANAALKCIQVDIAKITKNIQTAGTVVAVISKVLSHFPAYSASSHAKRPPPPEEARTGIPDRKIDPSR